MKFLPLILCVSLLTACGSGGPPPPDWKTDAANAIERYQKHALLGESTLAERHFQQAIRATGGAGRVTDTARLWLVHCATRRAMLIDDPCSGYVELARIEADPVNHAYYQFLMLRWDTIDIARLPQQHRELVSAPARLRPARLADVDDPIARLLGASLLVMRQEADAATLTLATDAASSQGWRQPLLTYLKLRETQAQAQGNFVEQAQLLLRIQLVEQAMAPP